MLKFQIQEPYRLGKKTVRGRFVIPSGIRCTHASTIAKCFREVPSVGVVTTKSISAAPRAGNREPIYARYAPGCYINAVGLANPGAQAFLEELSAIRIPEDKFLLVSVFGSDVESFLAAARTLAPAADGFELNMSCPHAKGYGAEVGQDLELLQRITAAVARETQLPVFVKLSPVLATLSQTAQAALAAGAAGLTLVNTVGPALAAHGEHAILANRLGGLSGDGIRPMGLRAVEQVRQTVGPGPVIIGMGGIAAPDHVRQYARAGADLFGIGSSLTGLDSGGMREFLARLEGDLVECACGRGYERSCETALPMDYFKTRVRARVNYDATCCKLILERLPEEYAEGGLAGRFFFLWIPGAGEKPFAVFSASERSVVVREAGPFSRRLNELQAGAEIFLRGPYGSGAPHIDSPAVIHVGGGTGIASLLEIAHSLRQNHRQTFLLGARTREHLFGIDKFEQLGEVLLATDDGSAGHHGLVTDLIPGAVLDAGDGPAFINCGPEPMVRRCFEIQRELTAHGRIFGSIEYRTSCGVGICGKCAAPSGALTCIDGPFLPMAEFLP
ncbi:MAG: tRNA-dihydrouridine synthase [Bryobacterales bacterium]|nr:tRNA-dihydrouridine synthase [Bryobacterales bacterium]